MSDKVTIYTLAEELNMSVSAVSRAFNPNTRLSPEKRKIILEAAEKSGYRQNKMASRLSQDPIRIGILMRGRIEAYYSKMLKGVDAALKDFQGYKLSCDIQSLSSENYNVASACKILDDFKKNKYNGVILHGIYHPEVVDKINELVDSGIKVVTLHNDIPGSKRLFSSTTNTEATGAMVTQLFDIMLPRDKRNIILFSGSMQSLIHQGLVFSFSKHSAEYNLRLIQHYDTLDIPQIAETLIKKAFDEHPETNAIYISSSNSIPICKYVEENNLSDKVTIIASDVFDELNEYIKKGIVDATIYQDPFHQGYSAIENLYYSIAESKDVPSLLMSRPQIVMKSNLDLYL